MQLDHSDLEIIHLLCKDAKLTLKEIGDKIHLTGQAVGIRVNRLIDAGIIKNFTINVDKEALGISITALVKIYMTTHDHTLIKHLISHTDEIVEAYRISGDACYLIKIETSSNEALNNILDAITQFANYQLSTSIRRLK